MSTRILIGSMLALLIACSGDGEEALRFESQRSGGPELLAESGPRPGAMRKLTVDELRASIATAAGRDLDGNPIRWEVDLQGNGQLVDALSDEAFGRMLGRPDYVTVTEESGEPSMLYAKMVRDMARYVCGRIVAADVQRPGSEATLWPHAPHASEPTDAQLTANLSYLLLRFFGVRASAGDPWLESFRDVYHASAATYQGGISTPQVEGWRGVCIALFEDPAFHIR